MKRLPTGLTVICLLFSGAVLWNISGCDYGRMRDDEAIRIYEVQMPDMPGGAVPITGGLNALNSIEPENMSNPLPDNESIVERGAESYGYYCSHCHGPQGRGYGTVGQSFSPLPTDLGSEYVLNQGDGRIFFRVSMGHLRHPPMYYTVSENDLWSIIRYLRQGIE